MSRGIIAGVVAAAALLAWLMLRGDGDARRSRGTAAPAEGPAAEGRAAPAPSPTGDLAGNGAEPAGRGGDRGAPPMLSGADAGPQTPRSFKRALLGQLSELDPILTACVSEAAARTPGLAGTVRVRFIYANGDAGGVVMELSEVDHEGTTIDDQALHACIAAAPREMDLPRLRADVDAISVGFGVSVVDGAYAGTEGREFSFLRDDDLPGR